MGCLAAYPVDGAAQFDGSAGMSAPANRQGARNRAERGRKPGNPRPDLANRFESAASARSERVKADLPLRCGVNDVHRISNESFSHGFFHSPLRRVRVKVFLPYR
jgi:hypothetical protein